VGILDRDPTPEDLEAKLDQPRPGVWAGEDGADLRALTQDQTDILIRHELIWRGAEAGERDAVARMCGYSSSDENRRLMGAADLDARAMHQRGGIDSDPLVRVLARRAWGDRDRQWFELRGVRKGDRVAFVDGPRRQIAKSSWWPESGRSERVDGVALANGRPGETVAVRARENVVWYQVSDRLREAPQTPQDAGQGLHRRAPRLSGR
jgi:hypothetical protein